MPLMQEKCRFLAQFFPELNGGMKNKAKWSYILQNLINAHMKWKISTTLLSGSLSMGNVLDTHL